MKEKLSNTEKILKDQFEVLRQSAESLRISRFAQAVEGIERMFMESVFGTSES